MQLLKASVLAVIIMLAAQVPVFADVGVPMLIVVYPGFCLALIPIILIETAVASKIFSLRYFAVLKTTVLANLASTIVGVPVTWVTLFALQMIAGCGGVFDTSTTWGKLAAVTLQSPWLIPYDNMGSWMLYAAAFSLCIPFFFMSVFSEYWVTKQLMEGICESALVWKWAWLANLCSYATIMLPLAAIALYMIFRSAG